MTDTDTITLVLDHRAAGTPATSRPVLAAALSLFGHQSPVRLVCVLDHEPALVDLDRFLADCSDVTDLTSPSSPDVLLVGPTDATGIDAVLEVTEVGEGSHDRQVIAALQAVAASVRERQQLERAHAITGEIRRQRDSARRARTDQRVHVLAVLAHLHSWGSLAPVVTALARRDDAIITVAALDDPVGAPGSVVAALTAQGITPCPLTDLVDLLAEVDVALLCDPYEEFRPAFLHLEALLDRGIRIAYSPYAENIGGEVGLQYDTPLHNLAWRVYVPDQVQRGLYAQHCTSGAAHVRVLGSLKADWLVAGQQAARTAGEAIRRRLRTRTAVLWNPHFRTGPGGWSTFERYLPHLVALAGSTPQVGLIIRPHPRLLADTEASGRAGRATVARFRDVWRGLPNTVLDESADYRPAFTASDAMVSDLSSLIPEYLRTGKPVAYLRHPSPPDTVADDAWLTRVEVIDDADALSRYLRAVTPASALSVPAPSVPAGSADAGAGERVASAIVEDLRSDLRSDVRAGGG